MESSRPRLSNIPANGTKHFLELKFDNFAVIYILTLSSMSLTFARNTNSIIGKFAAVLLVVSSAQTFLFLGCDTKLGVV